MSAQKTITVRLEAEDYNRLEAEARRQGMEPDALAQTYVRDGLPDDPTEDERRMQAGLDALARLAELRADLPEVDAVEIARQSREDLERRSIF